MNEPRHDPIAEFRARLRLAQAEPERGTAATLATADTAARPTARVVLLKGVDQRGFAFFTNYESRKAREMEENPRAALCFFWPSLHQQVRVEGSIARLEEAESDAYFRTRARASQVGAWASRQSAPLAAREELLERVRHVEERWAGHEVPRPPFWGGYLLAPESIEFWQGRENRLHDRLLYRRLADGWQRERLYP